MTFEELSLYLQLADTRNFARAAERCHLSPSAASRAITRLEDEVGARLFLRDNRTVELTPEGQRFREFAEETLAGWTRMREEMAGHGADLIGEASLYCTVTACYSILPALLPSFRAEYPKITITLQTGNAAQAIPQVLAGAVDLCIAPLPDAPPPTLAVRRLVTTPLVCIIPKMDGPVRDLFQQPDPQIAQAPMILSESELARKRIDAWFAAKGVTPRIYAQVAGNEAIIAMVSLGLGAGILPRLVAELSPFQNRIEIIPLDPPLEPYHLGLCTRKRRLASPVVRAFWEGAAV